MDEASENSHTENNNNNNDNVVGDDLEHPVDKDGGHDVEGGNQDLDSDKSRDQSTSEESDKPQEGESSSAPVTNNTVPQRIASRLRRS